jgi:hypothetical protein
MFDIIFYIDSGDLFFPEVDGEFLTEVIESHLSYSSCLFISYGNRNATWTKKDCFVYMDCNNESYWNIPQLEAGVSYWLANAKSKEILEEWLHYCKDYRILTDSENTSGLENDQHFIDHRHDQSILTNIKTKYSISPSKLLKNYIECNMWESLKYWGDLSEFERKKNLMIKKNNIYQDFWVKNYLEKIL